jgi:hypothetical protein
MICVILLPILAVSLVMVMKNVIVRLLVHHANYMQNKEIVKTRVFVVRMQHTVTKII